MDHTRSFADRIEETLIAGILGVMTLITFANVVTRYGFNQNILWALELTVFLFGWLVLLGASYAVKKGAHLGVDIVINILPPQPRRAMGLAGSIGSPLCSSSAQKRRLYTYPAHWSTPQHRQVGSESDFAALCRNARCQITNGT